MPVHIHAPIIIKYLLRCRRRQPQALAAAKERYSAAIDLFIAEQFIFDKQWTAVKARR